MATSKRVMKIAEKLDKKKVSKGQEIVVKDVIKKGKKQPSNSCGTKRK